MKKDLKTFYKNRLPHIAPLGAEFFVTFRLADSLPQHIIQSLKDELNIKIRELRKEKPKDFKYQINQIKHDFSYKYDKFLDNKPYGNCYLRNEGIAQLVANRIHEFDSKYYELEAYTIMPNHVHMLIDTSIQLENNVDESKYVQLNKIMQLIKGRSAREINKFMRRRGTLWMKDSYDHYILNAKDWENTIEYIINNPVEAGLVTYWKDWKFTYYKYL